MSSESLTYCKLCKSVFADKTGSHMLTAWLIASAFNTKGQKRDNEIIHKLDGELFRFPFFGRSVSLEKIEESIGRELSDREIVIQKNIFIEDYVFCKKCEKRLKTIEDAFLEKVHRKLDKEKFNNKDLAILNEGLITRVFFYSLIWRVSVSKFIGFKLPQNLENKLQDIINKTLELTLERTIQNFNKYSSNILGFPLIIVKLEKTEHPTEMPILFHLKYKRPFSIIINDYVILFYEKKRHLRSVKQSFFGITDMINPSELLNYNESDFKIGYLEEEKVKEIIKKIVEMQVEDEFNKMRQLYIEMFKNKFGRYPGKHLIKKFLKELVINDKKLGVKRTKESILEAMNKSLK